MHVPARCYFNTTGPGVTDVSGVGLATRQRIAARSVAGQRRVGTHVLFVPFIGKILMRTIENQDYKDEFSWTIVPRRTVVGCAVARWLLHADGWHASVRICCIAYT